MLLALLSEVFPKRLTWCLVSDVLPMAKPEDNGQASCSPLQFYQEKTCRQKSSNAPVLRCSICTRQLRKGCESKTFKKCLWLYYFFTSLSLSLYISRTSWPFFYRKKPYFGGFIGLKPKKRGQKGSWYIYMFTYTYAFFSARIILWLVLLPVSSEECQLPQHVQRDRYLRPQGSILFREFLLCSSLLLWKRSQAVRLLFDRAFQDYGGFFCFGLISIGSESARFCFHSGSEGMAFTSHGLGPAYGKKKGLACFYLWRGKGDSLFVRLGWGLYDCVFLFFVILLLKKSESKRVPSKADNHWLGPTWTWDRLQWGLDSQQTPPGWPEMACGGDCERLEWHFNHGRWTKERFWSVRFMASQKSMTSLRFQVVIASL